MLKLTPEFYDFVIMSNVKISDQMVALYCKVPIITASI